MRKNLLLVPVLFLSLPAMAQSGNDSSILISINQLIDDHVVKQDTAALNTLYASDFVFNHGSGRIEGKDGWFRSVTKGNFVARQHDSVTVELHPGIAVLRGVMHITKKNKAAVDRYHLRYVRVYAKRPKSWQLVSHVTTHEHHDVP